MRPVRWIPGYKSEVRASGRESSRTGEGRGTRAGGEPLRTGHCALAGHHASRDSSRAFLRLHNPLSSKVLRFDTQTPPAERDRDPSSSCQRDSSILPGPTPSRRFAPRCNGDSFMRGAAYAYGMAHGREATATGRRTTMHATAAWAAGEYGMDGRYSNGGLALDRPCRCRCRVPVYMKYDALDADDAPYFLPDTVPPSISAAWLSRRTASSTPPSRCPGR